MRQGKYKVVDGKFVHHDDMVGTHGITYAGVGAVMLIGLFLIVGIWVAAIFV